jgi:plasmid stabilization system protein ParE
MLQRSFRLSDDSLADLARIAEHLAALRNRAPNQTTTLARAISRGIDAIDATEKQAASVPDGVHAQLLAASQQLRGLAEKWEHASRKGAMAYASRRLTGADLKSENEALRNRVAQLEGDLERAKAKPYIAAGEKHSPRLRAAAAPAPAPTAILPNRSDALEANRKTATDGLLKSLSRDGVASKANADETDTSPVSQAIIAHRLIEAMK